MTDRNNVAGVPRRRVVQVVSHPKCWHALFPRHHDCCHYTSIGVVPRTVVDGLSAYLSHQTVTFLLTTGAVAADAPSKDVGRGRQRLPVKKKGGTYNKDDQRNRRQSLRVGTGSRKGRGAELSRRRGSLKKRDRSADKEARAAAAVERKTVDLPE